MDCLNVVVIITCPTNLYFLNDVNFIYMDGTFEYCPKHFTQLYTIHGYKNGIYTPLVFGLLPDKNSETYIIFLELLKKNMLNLGLQFQPQNIVLDFERAMHAAVNSCWKNVNIFGCKFHLHQNWFRKIQSLNLQQEYKNTNSIIGKYLKYYFGLCFLKPTDVTSFF